MNPISCIAIDDEPLALTIISEYVSKTPHLKLLKTFTNPTEASLFIQTEKPELMFIDIQMPEIKGTDFIQTLLYKPVIIFTTAYSEYALEGFNMDAVDYLVKPIAFNRFLQAINKSVRIVRPSLENNNTNTKSTSTEKDYFFVKSGYKSVKVYMEDILFIEGLKDYASIQTTEHKYIRHGSLKSLEDILNTSKFLRVHKSYIINLSKVKSFYGSMIEIENHKIPIGRAYKDTLSQHFKTD